VADDQVNVKFGAETGELKTGTSEAAAATETATKSMSVAFAEMNAQIAGSMAGVKAQLQGMTASVQSAMSSVNAVMAGITAVMAGGAIFKATVSETVALNAESMKLAATMGITTEEASGLISALDHVGVTTEQFSSATKMMVRSLGSNEKAFNDLGVATRDSNGDYRDMTSIMLDVNQKLAGLKEGTDREIAGKKLYGRAWDEVRKVIKLTADEMAEGAKRADALGLTVGPEAAAQTASYKLQMRELHQTFQSIGKVIGDALLPVLTAMGEWFNSIGPTVVKVFRASVNTLVSALDMMGLAITTLWDLAKGVFMSIGVLVGSVALAIKQAITGDFSGAADTMKSIGQTVKGVWIGITDDIEQHTKNAAERMQKRWGMIPAQKSAPKTGGNRITGEEGAKEEKPESRVPSWESDLEQIQEKNKEFWAEDLAGNRSYWQQVLAFDDLSAEEIIAVKHKIFEADKQIARDALAAQLQGMKEQSEAALVGSVQRVTIAQQEAKLIASKYGEGSKEAVAANREVDKMQREHAADEIKRLDMVSDHRRQLLTLDLDMEKQQIEYMKNIGAISDQEEFARLKALEDRKHAVEVEALNEKLAAARQGSIEEQKLMDELEVASNKHTQAIHGLNLKASQDQVSGWKSAFDGIASSFNSSITKMLISGGTFKDFMKSMASSVLSTFIGMALQSAEKWIWSQIVQTTATTVQSTARVATAETAAAAQLATTIAANVAAAGSFAALYAAAASASVAAIPFVGWSMAPGVGAAAYAEGMGFAAMASAAGGYDIPAGVNPVTQLHAQEMVLPAQYANVIRGVADSGGGSGGGDVHFHVNAMDAGGVAKFFQTHGRALAATIRNQSRNFNPAVS